MAMVDVAAYLGGPAAQADWLGPKVGGCPPTNASNDPDEICQWLCRDDSTKNVIMSIIIIFNTLGSIGPRVKNKN